MITLGNYRNCEICPSLYTHTFTYSLMEFSLCVIYIHLIINHIYMHIYNTYICTLYIYTIYEIRSYEAIHVKTLQFFRKYERWKKLCTSRAIKRDLYKLCSLRLSNITNKFDFNISKFQNTIDIGLMQCW